MSLNENKNTTHINQEENTMTVNNEVITKALTEAQSVDQMIAAFADQGIEITAEELRQAAKTAIAEESGEELSEGDLEGVAGGYGFNYTRAYNSACNIIRQAIRSAGSSIISGIKRAFGF